MSKLLSSSNSNSKNTSNLGNISKENKNSRDCGDKSHPSIGSLSLNRSKGSKGGEISSGNGSLGSDNNKYHYTKSKITAKRKKFYDKLMGKELKKMSSKNLDGDINKNKNKFGFEDDEGFESIKNLQNNQSTSSNFKITNITNIIVNVKSGTKSLDIRAINTPSNQDMMMRDMRELHIITKKALCTNSKINPLLDTLDIGESRQRNYSKNRIKEKSKKEFLIDDNSDYNFNQIPNNNKSLMNNNKNYLENNNNNINININDNKQNQIINIININGNYSMDQTKKKNLLSNLPKSNLSSIKECVYDTTYNVKPPATHKGTIKHHLDNEPNNDNFTNIINKHNKIKLRKASKLSKKNNSLVNNTINVGSTRFENANIKEYIEHLKSSHRITTTKKGTFLEINKSKK